jgi:hypothetical protein
MQGHAFLTSPLPHLKRTQPFRAAGGNAPTTNRARLGTVSPGNDARETACRNRPVRQHVAEHRPAGVGLRHSRVFASFFGLTSRSPRNAARDRATSRGGNAPAGWRFPPPASLRASARAVENTPSCFSSCVRILVLRSLNTLDRDDALQAEIDAEGGRVALFDLWYFYPDVDIPTPAGVGGELPRFGLPFSDIGLKSRR